MISQPVAFPLHPIVRGPDGEAHCGCGWARCSRIGKHPAVLWRDLAYGDVAPRPAPGAGIGIKTGAAPKGSGIIAIDLDGEDAIDAWNELGGMGDVETRIVQTGRLEGGLQLHLDHPGFPVKNSASSLAPGIDVRGDGGFVVVEGSPHRSGKTYELLTGGTPPAPCPPWLIEWLRAQPAPSPIQEYEGDIKDPDELEYRRELYAEYLRTEAPVRCEANRGRGDTILFDVVQRGAYDLALPTEDVLELVAEHYDPRNDRAWGDELEERVLHKAHTAKTSSTRARVEPLPDPRRDPELAAIFAPVDLDPNTLDLEDIDRERSKDEQAKAKQPEGLHFGGWDQVIEPPMWLVQGLIPIETVGMFVAIGSSLKTWTALDLAISVATGEPWLGRYPVRKGRVAIIDYESGTYELQRRVRLLAPDGDIENLGKWSMGSLPGVDDPELWKVLARVDGLQLCVFDSLAAGAPNVDENVTAAALPLTFAAKLADARGLTSLFIHHTTKGDGGGDSRKTVRGSTAIFAACDWAYSFENVDEVTDAEGGAVRRMKMFCIKPCMTARPAPVQLQLSDASGLTWYDEDGADASGAARVAMAKGDRSPEAIQAAIKLVLAAGAIESKEAVARAVGARTAVVNIELAALLKRREVIDMKNVGYMLDGASDRLARVLSTIEKHPYWRTDAQLAAAARVDKDDIAQLVLEKKITTSADNRWVVVGGAST